MTVSPPRTEGSGVRVVQLADFHAEMQAQGVAREDVAFRCVMCGTAQSIRSFVAAGAKAEGVERYVGFSCEGRFRGAKAATRDHKPADPNVRGCDWSLGGLFTLHKLEVDIGEGKRQPAFELATPEEAKALAAIPLEDLERRPPPRGQADT